MLNNQMFTPSIRVMLSTLNNPLTKFDNKTLLHNIGRDKFMTMRYYEKYGGGRIWQKIKRFGKIEKLWYTIREKVKGGLKWKLF